MLDIKKLAGKLNFLPGENTGKKWLLPAAIAIIFIIILLIGGNFLILFEMSHIDKFYPGSSIGRLALSGLNKEQAFALVERAADSISSQDVQIEYDNDSRKEVILLNQALNPDSAYNYLNYDVHQTVYDSFDRGRSGNWLRRLWEQWQLWAGMIEQKAVFKLDREYLKKAVSGQLQLIESKEMDAAPKISCSGNACKVEISPEKSGRSFNYDEALQAWSEKLAVLESEPIVLRQITVEPAIRQADVAGLTGRLQEFFNSSATTSLEYFYQDKKWQAGKSALAKFIDFERGQDGNIYISVNKDNFDAWFKKTIGEELDVPARNATIQISNGQAISLSSHKNGQTVDSDKAYMDLKQKVINQDFSGWRFELAVKTTTPDVLTENINNLGIREILGIGQSNFAGSPANRRKNIKNGASKLNGLLIKPDEEFSLVQTLLPVDASTGYFPELVIKGNKTTAEYGGGLCQIGTTIFRAALSTGLPILERQNHSYNVAYYLEGGLPGVDATIYDPKPDLRFKNDTGNYILIQSRIEGDNLYFEFWGTKDGRTAVRTKPKTWGVKAPPPTKIVESTDLAPGIKKCTETAHKGISASFDYLVNYSDGHAATTTFTSVYRPWQEVCLIGVASTSTTPVISNP